MRAKKAIQQVDEEQKVVVDQVDPPPAPQPEGEQPRPEVLGFFESIQQFSSEEWASGLKCYVYRTWPTIDKGDSTHYLSVLFEPFDEETVLRLFGSGKYFLRLNRKGKTIPSALRKTDPMVAYQK